MGAVTSSSLSYPACVTLLRVIRKPCSPCCLGGATSLRMKYTLWNVFIVISSEEACRALAAMGLGLLLALGVVE